MRLEGRREYNKGIFRVNECFWLEVKNNGRNGELKNNFSTSSVVASL